MAAQAQPDSAIVLLNRALQCASAIKDASSEADLLLDKGILEFRKIGPRDVPTRLFLESMALYTELKDTNGIARCNLQLGVLNYDIRNFEAAVTYFNHLLQSGTRQVYLKNLAHYLLALCYSEMKEFDKAEKMFDKAEAEVATTDSVFKLQILSFKGKMYANQGQSSKAVALLEEVQTKYQSTILKENFAPIYAFLSTAHLKSGNYKQAITYGREAYHKSLGKGSYTVYLREAEASLQQAFYLLGDMDSAYFYLNALSLLNDSISSDQVQQRVTEMSGQYEFQQKLKLQQAQQELKEKLARKELERQKLLRNILLSGILVLAFFAVVIYRQRSKTAKEKERSDQLLLNILPAQIAQELKETGKAKAQNYECVSIMFTDFQSFTHISASLSAQQLVNEINTCFEAFDAITEKYGIEKIKTIGDSYMAAGGLPIPHTESVRNTVLAALEMQHFLHTRHQKSQASTPFKMRVGIHTGPVVAGIVGVKKFQYDVWGDTVNTASRMESNGEINRVNISQSTYQYIKGDPRFNFEERGKIYAKGKGQVEMYYVSLA